MTTRITTLDNGLRIATDTITTVESVTLGIWVQSGSRHEEKDTGGISHFLEHMAFKGTTTRSARQIANEIESVGGFINAYTSREKTAYHVHLLKDHVELAVDILSDILQNSTFDEDEFAQEQQVILQEIGQTNDTPDSIVFDYFQETAYPDQPIGRPILGIESRIKSFTPQDLRDYMQKRYHPDQMLFCAAGNIDHDAFVSLVKKYFQMPAAQTPLSATAPIHYMGGDHRTLKDLEQAHIVYGFKGMSVVDQDYFSQALYTTVLGGGMSSRLFQEVREKRGLVYSIYSYNENFKDAGTFSIYAGTDKDRCAELMSIVNEQLMLMTKFDSDEELDRAKMQLKASTLMARESTSYRCEILVSHLINFGKPRTVEETVKNIEAVDNGMIREAALRTLNSEPTLAALGPIDKLTSYADITSTLKNQAA